MPKNNKAAKDKLFNEVEKEIVGLCICIEAINEIINRGLLEIRGSSESSKKIVYFHSQIHQDLFLLRLLDFSKETGDSQLTGVKGSCLQILKSISDNAHFSNNNSIRHLKFYVEELFSFLNHETTLKLWLPSLDIEAIIKVPRIELLTISGNCCKHNLSRLTGVSKITQNILEKNGYEIDINKIPLALDNFRDHLQSDYFVYYGSWLAENLNNIRWGIQYYLYPLFINSYIPNKDTFAYNYTYPSGLKSETAKEWFWRLMNNIRSEPIIEVFEVHDYLKVKSHLEEL